MENESGVNLINFRQCTLYHPSLNNLTMPELEASRMRICYVGAGMSMKSPNKECMGNLSIERAKVVNRHPIGEVDEGEEKMIRWTDMLVKTRTTRT
uniref:Uncharacterized protein n=1 Tax=Oryza barthii TaxID=65489 RepID=A0A0D3HBW2_9ORYZ